MTRLTERERALCRVLLSHPGLDCSRRALAAEFGINILTVQSHLGHIYDKVGASNILELTIMLMHSTTLLHHIFTEADLPATTELVPRYRVPESVRDQFFGVAAT